MKLSELIYYLQEELEEIGDGEMVFSKEIEGILFDVRMDDPGTHWQGKIVELIDGNIVESEGNFIHIGI